MSWGLVGVVTGPWKRLLKPSQPLHAAGLRAPPPPALPPRFLPKIAGVPATTCSPLGCASRGNPGRRASWHIPASLHRGGVPGLWPQVRAPWALPLCASAPNGAIAAPKNWLLPSGVDSDAARPSATPTRCRSGARSSPGGGGGALCPRAPVANHPVTVRLLAGFYWGQCGGMQGLTVPGLAPPGLARGFFGLRLSLVRSQQSVPGLPAAPRAPSLLVVVPPARHGAGPAVWGLEKP